MRELENVVEILDSALSQLFLFSKTQKVNQSKTLTPITNLKTFFISYNYFLIG